MAALVALAVMAMGACSFQRSGYQFVRNQPTGTYLKVPEDWEVHGNGEIKALVEETGDLPTGYEKVLPFVATFGADRDLVAYPFDPFGERPAGIVQVRRLAAEERDTMSFANLRNEIVSIDDGQKAGVIDVLTRDEFDQSSSVRGERLVFAYTEPESNVRFVIDQTTLVDADTSRVYLLAVGCIAECYDRHQQEIETVVTSLTIKER